MYRKDRNEGRENTGQSHDQSRNHLLFCGRKARHFEDTRRIVHDDVHTGKLLHRLQQHTEKHSTTDVTVDLKQCPTALF